MSTPGGAPVSAGARPSLKALRKAGKFVPVAPAKLSEGDVILYEESAYYVMRSSRTYGKTYTVLRELVTHHVRTVRILPRIRLLKVVAPEVVTGEWEGRYTGWKIASGDVILYPGSTPWDSVAAIRHGSGWYRTAPPWMPLSDVEVSIDLSQRRARMVRSSVRTIGMDQNADFLPGSLVASRPGRPGEPSVWLRKKPDYWVGDARGAVLSDQMIRFELERRTCQVLRLPEEQ